MNTKELPSISAQSGQEPPHRAMSRAPENHNVVMVMLGLLVVAVLFAVLWALYAFG